MTTPFSSSRLRELHDRLGSMIDQVGQPDYSLRELVEGLREVRDAMFTLSETTRLSDLIPTSWLDPLLTGPSAALPSTGNIEPQHVEALLRRLKKRIQEAEDVFVQR